MASELRVNQITSITGVGTVSFDAGGVTFSGSPNLGNAAITSINSGPIAGSRNRIINGDCRIDQRNGGASVTGNNDTFAIDRFKIEASQTSKLTAQQNAGSVTPPIGFTSYFGVTSSSAYSLSASDYFTVGQAIEGYNVSDFAFGSTSPATVTLSFWVRSSLTGTFGGSLRNNDASRSRPFTYTILSVNTWEYKTITIAGDTAGTWLTTNGVGLRVLFSLGTGSTYSGTAGSWAGANYVSATGATSVVSTNGATWYITGIQLESGTVSTPFERRSYGQELALCQRYYYSATSQGYWFFPPTTNDVNGKCNVMFKQTMRATPTTYAATRSTSGSATISFDNITVDGASIALQSWGNAAAQLQSLTASAEL